MDYNGHRPVDILVAQIAHRQHRKGPQMSIYDEIAVLHEVPPFATLDQQKLKLLAFVSELVSYSAGESIVKQGDKGDAVFVLIDGLIDVYITSDGVSSHVREMGRHAFFGELAVMLNAPRAANVIAKTDIAALKISKDCLHGMIKENPELGARITDHIEQAGYTFGCAPATPSKH